MKKILFLIFVLNTSFAFLFAAPSSKTSPSPPFPDEAFLNAPQVRVKPGHYLFNDTTIIEASSKPASNSSGNSVSPVIEEVPPEVIINGKPASQLTDEETQKFLQSKIKRIKQRDLQVCLIRIASGYPVTLVFSEPVKGSSIGDNKLIGVETPNSQELILKALAPPPGDTSFQVVTKDGKRFVYHLFITDNLVNADLIICVNKPWGFPIGYLLKWIIILGALGCAGYFAYKKFGNKFISK
jgi:hypothetical protein